MTGRNHGGARRLSLTVFNPIRWLARYLRDRRGAVSPLLVLAMVPIIGAMGMGLEASNWWMLQRNLQNAADAAAISAAVNGGTTVTAAPANCTSGANAAIWYCEAIGSAKNYGFANGTANVTVTPAQLQSGCPGTASSICYKVSITKTIPLYLLPVVGFSGQSGRQSVQAVAIAVPPGPPIDACAVTLGTSGKKTSGFTINGNGGGINLNGCSILSNSTQKCSGTSGGIGNAYSVAAPNGNQGCGTNPKSGSQYLLSSDPWQDGTLYSLNKDIPSGSCGSIPTTETALSTSSATWNGVVQCGTVKLSGLTCVSAANTTLVIYNGALDLNGNDLGTSGGSFSDGKSCSGSAGTSSLTIIFTGPSGGTNGGSATYQHYVTNASASGGIAIEAPDSGTLHGVAIMANSTLTGSKDDNGWTINGGGSLLSDFDIQGLVYLPNADLLIDGAVKQFPGGFACMQLVTNSQTYNGGGSIFANPTSQCGASQADLTLQAITGTHQFIQALVQ